MFKFTLVAIELGATGYTIYRWKDLDETWRVIVAIFLVMGFIGSLPGFLEGAEILRQSIRVIVQIKPVVLLAWAVLSLGFFFGLFALLFALFFNEKPGNAGWLSWVAERLFLAVYGFFLVAGALAGFYLFWAGYLVK